MSELRVDGVKVLLQELTRLLPPKTGSHNLTLTEDGDLLLTLRSPGLCNTPVDIPLAGDPKDVAGRIVAEYHRLRGDA